MSVEQIFSRERDAPGKKTEIDPNIPCNVVLFNFKPGEIDKKSASLCPMLDNAKRDVYIRGMKTVIQTET